MTGSSTSNYCVTFFRCKPVTGTGFESLLQKFKDLYNNKTELHFNYSILFKLAQTSLVIQVQEAVAV